MVSVGDWDMVGGLWRMGVDGVWVLVGGCLLVGGCWWVDVSGWILLVGL